MNIYQQKRRWKILLLVFAILIAALSLAYTNYLVGKISEVERNNAELWAKAQRSIIEADSENSEFFEFLLYVINETTSVPVILTDEKGGIIAYRELDSARTYFPEREPEKRHDPKYFENQLRLMNEQHEPIILELIDGRVQYVFYRDSQLLTELRYFPYIQLSIISLFLIVAYIAFSSSRKSEQNQVWVGMAKETAHQLGTPISSLLAWMELIKERYKSNDDPIFREMENDIERLELITDRFSKIGSTPVLEPHDLKEVTSNYIEYLRKRTSNKINFSIHGDSVIALLSIPLFEWVLENLCKNAVNAIGNNPGNIELTVSEGRGVAFIDIKDDGMGIPKSKWETVFQPGYTTRKRGWGLGLSLTRRIVEHYHKGQIFVKESELGNGTVFRVLLNIKK